MHKHPYLFFLLYKYTKYANIGEEFQTLSYPSSKDLQMIIYCVYRNLIAVDHARGY